MSEPFQQSATLAEPKDPEKEKKRKMWRNLFILNLCISLLLMGLFWLPHKFVQLNEFMGSSSVEPRRKAPAFMEANEEAKPQPPSHLKESKFAMINATSEEDWTYFDFSRGKQVDIFDKSSREWDLAFRRGNVLTNGGATNKFGKGGVLDLGEVDFDSVDQVPNRPFVADQSTRTETKNEALAQWYSYNYITHKLTPRKHVYIVKAADGRYAKVQFLGFYCANKEPGCVQIRYTFQDNGAPNFMKNQEKEAPIKEASIPSDQKTSDL
ncbi:MAG: hypothetical protein G3M70_00310 [Candidatus Nitronauta litoralis]|uniref:Uncharacterized protein n=1 Tax=Candidatus Nitronauta litoralis TaxID=2705533 RepID=A0A7T0BSY1_9BACT|nr:MAG: hypothetical protein G3M70_00310 [Candidatus Nitronauta litoralis]